VRQGLGAANQSDQSDGACDDRQSAAGAPADDAYEPRDRSSGAAATLRSIPLALIQVSTRGLTSAVLKGPYGRAARASILRSATFAPSDQLHPDPPIGVDACSARRRWASVPGNSLAAGGRAVLRQGVERGLGVLGGQRVGALDRLQGAVGTRTRRAASRGSATELRAAPTC
jgi:hypothetical protein